MQSSSIDNDLTGFIIVLNTTGRIILLSDNVEYYLRKNVVCRIYQRKKKIFFFFKYFIFLSEHYTLN